MARANQRFTDESTLEHNVGIANNGNIKAVARSTIGLRNKDGLINVHGVLRNPRLSKNPVIGDYNVLTRCVYQ